MKNDGGAGDGQSENVEPAGGAPAGGGILRAQVPPAVAVLILGGALGVAAAVAIALEPKVPVDFEAFERRVYSQGGEDGVIELLFSMLDPGPKYAVEFGGGDGVKYSNVRNLVLKHGWRALMIDGDKELVDKCTEAYREHPGGKCVNAWVYPGNVELLFEQNGVPYDVDLLVIDIDSNDYYVWRAIHDFRPKVVMIEVNAAFAPPANVVVSYSPFNYWDGGYYYGASLQALYELGKKKGYELIYMSKNGFNAFFVRAEDYERFELPTNAPEAIYHPNESGFFLRAENIGRLMDEQGHPTGRQAADLTWDAMAVKKRWVQMPSGLSPRASVPSSETPRR